MQIGKTADRHVRRRAAQVMAIVTNILAGEAQIMDALRQGSDPAAARARHGRFSRQSRPPR